MERAAMAGLPFATLLREALGLAETRRRRPVPKVDPELIRAIARIGSNLNQIARWLNTAQRQGNVSAIDAMAVSARLISLDRGLAETLDAFRVREHGQC
ncbi:plasmid mobilization relaxosome protein MobC [Ochrobactrum sp. C6C9]|nr:plasmid mobilization relaxosome protein MobC [Ochrobactrum sp. C6C9]